MARMNEKSWTTARLIIGLAILLVVALGTLSYAGNNIRRERQKDVASAMVKHQVYATVQAVRQYGLAYGDFPHDVDVVNLAIIPGAAGYEPTDGFPNPYDNYVSTALVMSYDDSLFQKTLGSITYKYIPASSQLSRPVYEVRGYAKGVPGYATFIIREALPSSLAANSNTP